MTNFLLGPTAFSNHDLVEEGLRDPGQWKDKALNHEENLQDQDPGVVHIFIAEIFAVRWLEEEQDVEPCVDVGHYEDYG